ncbi:hypothetical protein Bca4012_098408 [Brassica carinata]
MQVDRNVNRKSVRSLDVPVSSVFKRLFQDVVDTTNDAVPPSNQGKLLTPYTPRNISKCFKSLPDNIDKKRFLWISFQPDFDCSSQENTDSESEPEIEVVDLTVDTEPYTVLKTNIVKSLAALFEEAFCATEKPAKKALPKEDAYIDEGDATYTCTYCGAIMWFGERLNRRLKTPNPKFSLCCMQGQVQLPLLKQPPEVLKNLLTGGDKLSKHFQRNTRPYNMVFSFTSLGAKIDRSVRKGKGPNMLVLQGENYLLIGSLQPPNGNDAKFGHLYIVDTENEAENRTKALSSDLLDSFHMRIVSDRAKDGRTYDTPTASEVAALIPGDFNLDMDKRDIVLQQKSGKLLRIDEIHASYLALQCPLLFVHGEDGFRLGIKKGVTKATEKLKKENISMRQFFAFRLHERKNEAPLQESTPVAREICKGKISSQIRNGAARALRRK